MTKKITYLEKLRVFALLMVLYTHSSELGVLYYQNPKTTIGYWVSLCMLPISQCCVVLFFMISGALLLKKEETLGKLYLHRVLPMGIVTALFVLIQYVQNCFDYKQPFSVLEYVKALYSGGSITEHWFLYAYLSFLMLLPFLRAMVKGMKEHWNYRYLFLIMLVIQVLSPMWEAVSDFEKMGLYLPVLETIVFYPCMGYYLEQVEDSILQKKTWLMLANGMSIVLCLGNMWMNHHSLQVGGVTAYRTLFLPIFACVLFWDFKMLLNQEKHASIWSFAGAGVFGTYLMEPQLRHLLAPLDSMAWNTPVPYMANILVLLVMAFLGIIFSNLIKKLPGVKKLL